MLYMSRNILYRQVLYGHLKTICIQKIQVSYFVIFNSEVHNWPVFRSTSAHCINIFFLS